ncbi:MAG TPA: hypothetical protein VEW48_13360 [Thermoanaerobaculia bacterium]|nr:hypothetical protein [Thermoanaerobaculia bacterium]
MLTPEAAECPACGVILAKLRAGLSRPFRSVRPTPAVPSNPYAPPTAEIESPPIPFPSAVPVQDVITRPTLAALEATRPWLRFVVVYSIVMVSIMLLAAVGLLLFGMTKPEMMPFALVYLLYGGVGFALLAPLRRSSEALGRLVSHGASACLETFAQEQAVFWRRWGLVCAVSLALVGVGMVIGVGAAIFAAAAR